MIFGKDRDRLGAQPHRRARRVLHLDPGSDPARAVGRIAPFRDYGLAAELAGMPKHDRAVRHGTVFFRVAKDAPSPQPLIRQQMTSWETVKHNAADMLHRAGRKRGSARTHGHGRRLTERLTSKYLNYH